MNFDIIHHQCCDDNLIGDYKDYKTIKIEDPDGYPKKKPKLLCQLFLEKKERTYGLTETS